MEYLNGPLDSPSSPEKLRFLAKSHILDAKALERAFELVQHLPDRQRWARFLDLFFLVFGAGFTISGIFFFFAFNWSSLHRYFKLGLLEFALLAAIGLLTWRGLDRLSGKIILISAALIVGALIGVYGQVYQTGTDSYLLFLFWTLLTLGWVLLSNFAPLWFLWILLLDVTLWLYWDQMVGKTYSILYLILFIVNGGGVLAWELASSHGVEWLRNRWTPRLLYLPACFALVAPTMSLIFSSPKARSSDPWLTLMPFLLVCISAIIFYFYAQKTLDLFMLTICCVGLIIAFDGWITKILSSGTEVMLIIMSLLLIGEAALVVTMLRKVSKSWEERESWKNRQPYETF